jgi:putative hydrolase of the HAD superfamily
MSLPMPRAVFFDLGGTLLHPVSVGDVYAEIGRRHGSARSAVELRNRFGAAFRAQEEVDRGRGWITDEARERDRWRSIVRDTLDDVADFEACFADLYRFYAGPQGWTLDPEAAAVLQDLQGRGIRLGIASNYDHRLFSLVRAIPELAPLELLVVSADVGQRKPAPAFYQAVQRAANVPADSILMVGDDVVCDYEGALACGLRAVLLDPAARLEGGNISRIGKLSELLVSSPDPLQ